ncbi:MAG: hypothetical protein IJ716_12570 [Lachnospiraceae bacterium]|nr:hypothetical protein [Lachnospiraceae bacterium]
MKNQMKAKKRNGFWTFCFSFVPGCAEMYWGFMQAGVSLLIPFTGLIFLAYLMGMEELLFLDMIVYIYAFFHARNMAHLSEEEVRAMEDGSVNLLAGIGVTFDTLRKRSVARLAGILLIIFGVYEVLRVLYWSIPLPNWINRYAGDFLRSFPQGATAVLLIVLGAKLITGKKRELDRELERDVMHEADTTANKGAGAAANPVENVPAEALTKPEVNVETAVEAIVENTIKEIESEARHES